MTESFLNKRLFSIGALEENLTDEFQLHQMCSVEDRDKEEGTPNSVRTARSHSRSGRLQQTPGVTIKDDLSWELTFKT